MSKPNKPHRVSIYLRVSIQVLPGVEPIGVLDMALSKMHDALDEYEARNRDEVIRASISGDIRNAEVTDVL